MDECEKGILRIFSAGGCASAGYAEDEGATGYARVAPLVIEDLTDHLHFLPTVEFADIVPSKAYSARPEQCRGEQCRRVE